MLMKSLVYVLTYGKGYYYSNKIYNSGLKVNDQLVAYATRFLGVRRKNYVRSHHHALQAKVQCGFFSSY